MIVAGFGYRTGATVDDLQDALLQTGASPEALTSIDNKAQGPLKTLANAMNLPLISVSRDQIAGVSTQTHSPRIMALFATGSLAEAAALVAAGTGSTLITARIASPNGMATAAIAQGHPL